MKHITTIGNWILSFLGNSGSQYRKNNSELCNQGFGVWRILLVIIWGPYLEKGSINPQKEPSGTKK